MNFHKLYMNTSLNEIVYFFALHQGRIWISISVLFRSQWKFLPLFSWQHYLTCVSQASLWNYNIVQTSNQKNAKSHLIYIYIPVYDIYISYIWYMYIYIYHIHARHAHLYFIHTFSVAICFSFIKVHFRPLFGAETSPTTWDSKGPWVSKNCGRSMKPRWKLVAKKVPVMQPSVLSSTTSRLDISGGKGVSLYLMVKGYCMIVPL